MEGMMDIEYVVLPEFHDCGDFRGIVSTHMQYNGLSSTYCSHQVPGTRPIRICNVHKLLNLEAVAWVIRGHMGIIMVIYI